MLPPWYTTYKNFIDSSIKSYLEEYLNPIVIPTKAEVYENRDNSTLNKETNTNNQIIDSGLNPEGQKILQYSNPLNNFKEIVFYATNSGKRVRAILALEIYLNLTKKSIEDIKQDDDIMKICIALEFIHAYSLIHDDLPCMDNDDYRRGQLTVWKKYGETNAVLCGDLLNTLTFEILSTIHDNEKSKKIINLISRATSIYGMIGGQIEDIYFENNPNELDLELLKGLHNKKTGKLIEASILAGAILSGNISFIKNLSTFGQNVGLAFQIKDDILDVEGTFEETGKSVGGEKKGFVHFIGLQKSKAFLEELSNNSLSLIKDLKSEKLEFLVNYIKERSS